MSKALVWLVAIIPFLLILYIMLLVPSDMSPDSAQAYGLIAIYLSTLGMAVGFGAVAQYFTRNQLKSIVITVLFVFIIMVSSIVDERSLEAVLRRLLSSVFIASFVVLGIFSFAGAHLASSRFTEDGRWQRLSPKRQGMLLGLLFGFASNSWFEFSFLSESFLETPIIFTILGYIAGKFIVGRRVRNYTIDFFSLFIVSLLLVSSISGYQFNVEKKGNQEFIDGHLNINAIPTKFENLYPIFQYYDTDYERDYLKVSIQTTERGLLNGTMQFHEIARKYIKTVPDFSEVTVENKERFSYYYNGKKCEVFLSSIALHPDEGYTYFAFEYEYNIADDNRAEATIEFLETHITPEYLPPDLKSHILGSGMRNLPESTYLVGGGKYFNGKQYTRFDSDGDIVFIYDAWGDSFPQNFTGAEAYLRTIIKSVPQETLEFDVENISYLDNRKKVPTLQYVSRYNYEGLSYELVLRNDTAWSWIRLKKSKPSLNPVTDKEHAMKLAKEYYPELDFIDTELIHTEFEELWFVLYKGIKEMEKENGEKYIWEYTSCVFIDAEEYSNHWKHNMQHTTRSYSYESAIGSCIANI